VAAATMFATFPTVPFLGLTDPAPVLAALPLTGAWARHRVLTETDPINPMADPDHFLAFTGVLAPILTHGESKTRMNLVGTWPATAVATISRSSLARTSLPPTCKARRLGENIAAHT
jgi:hypothetical protein